MNAIPKPATKPRANKTDTGNSSKAICRVSNVHPSPSPDPWHSANSTFHRRIMIKSACLLITLKMALLSGFAAEPQTAVEDISISYLKAADAYQALKNEYPEIADIVRTIRIDKNSVSINGDHPKAVAFRQSLAELDLSPKYIVLESVITEVTKSTGKVRVVSRPLVYTLEHKPAIFALPSTSDDKELKISVIHRLVPRSPKE